MDSERLLRDVARMLQSGDPISAGRTCRSAIAETPDDAQVLVVAGLAFPHLAATDAAIVLLRRAIALDERNIAIRTHLAGLLQVLGRGEELAAAYRGILDLDGQNAVTLHNLGATLQALGRMAEASTYARRTVALMPEAPEPWLSLGEALGAQGRWDEALICCRHALVLRTVFPEAWNSLGLGLRHLARPKEAMASFATAVAHRADYVQALNNLGNVAHGLRQLGEALRAYRRTAVLAPDLAAVHRNLGNAWMELGETAAASTAYRRSLAIEPAPKWHSNLVLALCYAEDTANDVLFREVVKWSHRHAPTNRAKPRRRVGPARLKVGLLSADLRDHPVARNVLGVFEHHTRVALHGYAELAREDATTARLRGLADGWTATVGLSDEAVAERMRQDGIDLLLVLGGHTASNRPLVAAWGAAPVQASLYDLTSSGMAAMDWWLTDDILHPLAGTTERFAEKLWRLPSLYLHQLPVASPDVGPLPCENTGSITFVSCNNPAKMTPAVIRVWAAVLLAVPGARLLLKYRDWFADEALQAACAARFEAQGIDRRRLVFRHADLSWNEHLTLLQKADIALDPFPFNGATTTFEALWMGLPPLVLAGDRFLARMGASMLHQVGLDELVARDADDYVARAAALANDRPRLATLRRTLRPRLLASRLCDAPGYTRDFEAALVGMAGG
jgi:protein O-GlcNAc transferase